MIGWVAKDVSTGSGRNGVAEDTKAAADNSVSGAERRPRKPDLRLVYDRGYRGECCLQTRRQGLIHRRRRVQVLKWRRQTLKTIGLANRIRQVVKPHTQGQF